MAKQWITLLGLSAALALATGCGKSFEAIQRKAPPSASDDGEEIRQRKIEADNLETDASDVLSKLNIPFIDAKDTSALASEEILGVSLTKQNDAFNFQALVKGDEGTYQSVRAVMALPYRDGDAQYSIDGMIEVAVVQTQDETSDSAVSSAVQDQYSLVYFCTNACARVSVRLQRVIDSITNDNGDVLHNGYAASFTFDVENDLGTLIFSTLNQNTDVDTVEVALLKLQEANQEEVDNSTSGAMVGGGENTEEGGVSRADERVEDDNSTDQVTTLEEIRVNYQRR